ncbi:hypothetical protein [Streptomyces sp. NPDC005407]
MDVQVRHRDDMGREQLVPPRVLRQLPVAPPLAPGSAWAHTGQ